MALANQLDFLVPEFNALQPAVLRLLAHVEKKQLDGNVFDGVGRTTGILIYRRRRRRRELRVR